MPSLQVKNTSWVSGDMLKDDKKLLSVHFLREFFIYYLCIPKFDLHFSILFSWIDYRGKWWRNLTRENWRRGFHCNEERYLLDAVAGAHMNVKNSFSRLSFGRPLVFVAWTLWLVEKFKPDAATNHINHSNFSCSRVTNQLESSLGERVFSRAWLPTQRT